MDTLLNISVFILLYYRVIIIIERGIVTSLTYVKDIGKPLKEKYFLLFKQF